MGSGSSSRQTTDQLPFLDVRELKRDGLISGPGQERVAVLVHFRKRGEKRAVELVARLRLAWTACNAYGGSRPWFVCEGCGRRAAIVYGPSAPPVCRLCRGLTYASQRR